MLLKRTAERHVFKLQALLKVKRQSELQYMFKLHVLLKVKRQLELHTVCFQASGAFKG